MGKPSQLSREQVKLIKQKNNGAPISVEKINVDAKGIFSRAFKVNENDVIMLNLIKQ